MLSYLSGRPVAVCHKWQRCSDYLEKLPESDNDILQLSISGLSTLAGYGIIPSLDTGDGRCMESFAHRPLR
jgi:hypothetical protein